MSDEIEVVSDDEGVVVMGDRSVVERFLGHVGLLGEARDFELEKLRTAAQIGADLANAAAGMAEKSAQYVKLTPESAKRLREAGGFMKTKTKGVSHIMLGETGTKSLKWLQAQDGPTSLLTNPAVLAGVGGLMTQYAQQAEAQELKQLLIRIDEKLDDVRRGQRDNMLARMMGAAAELDEAITIREAGGDPKTLWDKVSGVSSSISVVQDEALLALGALADKIDGKSKPGELRKAVKQVERDAAVQLAVLARCFELQDQFGVVELDHVRATSPEVFERHRLGVSEARKKRRTRVLEITSRLMSRMDAAGQIASENIILHAREARSVVDSLNLTAEAVDEFHVPLGIELVRDRLDHTPWREALRDKRQLKTAGKEAGRNALIGAIAIASVVVVPVVTKVVQDGLKTKP